MAAALGSLPYLIFSLPAGALLDRWDRKRVMIACDIGRALAVSTVPLALWLDVLTVWQLYAAAFVEGSLFVFFNIAEVAALPRVVPAAQLPQAAAMNEAAFGAAHIVGPRSARSFIRPSAGLRLSSPTRCRSWRPRFRWRSSGLRSGLRLPPLRAAPLEQVSRP